LSKVGIEIAFTHDDNIERFELRLTKHTLSKRVYFAVGWYPPDDELQYLDSGGEWRAFATDVRLTEDTYLFNHFKLVCNLVNDKYYYALLNEEGYSLEDKTPYIDPSPSTNYIVCGVKITAITGTNPVSYVDNFILTINEP